MEDVSAIIPAPSNSDGYVELAGGEAGKPGRFRKHILNLGDLHYKGKTYTLDDGFYNKMADNFNSGVSMCQVPVADKDNQHTEDPLRNSGEVVGLEREGNKVFTVVDIRDPKVADGIRNKTILGASAYLAMNYEDTRTGKKVGPALLHHCITNRPHVLDLDPYEEVIAASADGTSDVIVLAQEEPEVAPTKDELIAQLKNDHGVDVAALEQAAAQRVDTAALTAELVKALNGSGTVKLAASDEVDMKTVVDSIAELALTNKAQGAEIETLKLTNATAEVEGYIDAGRLLPKTKDVAIQMALSNRESLEAILAPVETPYVKLNNQSGINPPDGEQKQEQDVDAELARLTAEHPDVLKK